VTAPFDRLDAIAAGTLTAVMGEAFTLLPRAASADVNAPGQGADPDRAARTVIGIYRDAPQKLHIVNAFDRQADQRPGAAIGEPTIEIDPRIQSPALAFLPRKGDQIRREKDGALYELLHADSDGMSRLLCRVNRIQ